MVHELPEASEYQLGHDDSRISTTGTVQWIRRCTLDFRPYMLTTAIHRIASCIQEDCGSSHVSGGCEKIIGRTRSRTH
jgi:hypothetical protein